MQYNILKREVDTNRELYNGLLQRFKEVDVAGGVHANTVFLIERAEVPGGASSPNLSRALILAFGLGLGGGLAAAYLLEQLDETDPLARRDGTDVGPGHPWRHSAWRRTLRPKTNLPIPDPPCRKPIARCARRCSSRPRAGLAKTLLITSSGPGEGKSLTSLGDRPALCDHGTEGSC